jgi:hypothetical protein
VYVAPIDDRLNDDSSKPANRESRPSVNHRNDRIATESSSIERNTTENDNIDENISDQSEGCYSILCAYETQNGLFYLG